jgi:hypothetical protein
VHGRRKTGAIEVLVATVGAQEDVQAAGQDARKHAPEEPWIIKPEKTVKACPKRPLGAPTGQSKVVKDASNAIHNLINSPIRATAIKRQRKGGGHRHAEVEVFAERSLTDAEVKDEVERILNRVGRPQRHGPAG